MDRLPAKPATTVHASSVVAKLQADDSPPWELGSQERIMILAPHPDDEVLAAGGVIATAQKQHNPVRVAVATNGDASYSTVLARGSHFITRKNFKRQAVMRQAESLNALADLGIRIEQVH